MVEAARAFHERAGLALPETNGAVIEVAHQPLFLPSPGFFEKIALGCWLAEKRKGVCVFGFVDDDYALFPALWSARLPARNKKGFEKIGFDYEPQRKAFFVLPKPSPAQVKTVGEKTGLSELLEESWRRALSLSEFNAITAASVCESLGLRPLFFEYSKLPCAAFDAQTDFFKEKQREFAAAFNESLKKRGVSGIKPLKEDELPLWRVKRDGSKQTLFAGEKLAAGERVAFKAVARNIAFASLLGSSAYVSGAGALSEERGYAAVAHDVARSLGVREPETFVWRNTNVYHAASKGESGAPELEREVTALKAVLDEAKKREAGLLAERGKGKIIPEKALASAHREKKAAERAFQRKQGELLALRAAERLEKQATLYSIADLLAVVDAKKICAKWFASLDAAQPARKEFFVEYSTVTRFI
ncbi:MAG: hypothetical protein QW343_04005 [Candidatus Norongarragalinales archaeon]